jgi:putative intracellular protease/amidase
MAKILFVLTGASYWMLKDGHRHPTGYWAEEFVARCSAFTEAGHEVTVATPSAVVPTVDTMSLRPELAGSAQKAREEEDVIERADELRWPSALKDARLEDYDAVYSPGGHGPMEDLAFDADSGRLLVEALASGLASRAKWLMEDEVKKLGVQFCRGPIWQPYTVADRNLYTGQNPASAGPVVREPLKVLHEPQQGAGVGTEGLTARSTACSRRRRTDLHP